MSHEYHNSPTLGLEPLEKMGRIGRIPDLGLKTRKVPRLRFEKDRPYCCKLIAHKESKNYGFTGGVFQIVATMYRGMLFRILDD